MLKNHKTEKIFGTVFVVGCLLTKHKRGKKFGTVFVGQNTKNLLTLINAHTCTFLKEKHYICIVIDN